MHQVYILECAYEWLRMSIGSTIKAACVCVLSPCEYALRNTPRSWYRVEKLSCYSFTGMPWEKNSSKVNTSLEVEIASILGIH